MFSAKRLGCWTSPPPQARKGDFVPRRGGSTAKFYTNTSHSKKCGEAFWQILVQAVLGVKTAARPLYLSVGSSNNRLAIQRVKRCLQSLFCSRASCCRDKRPVDSFAASQRNTSGRTRMCTHAHERCKVGVGLTLTRR
jgi:hypothetical protein